MISFQAASAVTSEVIYFSHKVVLPEIKKLIADGRIKDFSFESIPAPNSVKEDLHQIKFNDEENDIEELTKIEGTNTEQNKKAIAILELSQKTADIYDSRTNDEKREILIELFSKMTADGNSVSVTLTDFARSIMQKSRKDRQTIRRTLHG